ncbi:potassium channel family protein [Aquihabitans sp. McL0605]|uniref:potassium channel family protein n=1 Tax=Aquihabitans sp. McL0605 TaxID=3415671 RepID=UPI003CEA63F7
MRIRSAQHPLAEALAVISLLFSLVVVGFAGSYYSLSLHTDQFPDIHTRIDALYFTIVTIGTVGYGDIVPSGQEARLLVSLQIMLNLTLIATVVRLLGRVATSTPAAREHLS